MNNEATNLIESLVDVLEILVVFDEEKNKTNLIKMKNDGIIPLLIHIFIHYYKLPKSSEKIIKMFEILCKNKDCFYEFLKN